MSTKTANLYVRIEPDVKERAESILARLGIPASNAVNMMYKQIIIHNGLPFQLRLPRRPPDMSMMSEAEIDSELQGAYDSISGGGGMSVGEARERCLSRRKQFA